MRPRYSVRLPKIAVNVDLPARKSSERGPWFFDVLGAVGSVNEVNEVNDGAPDQGTPEMILNNGFASGSVWSRRMQTSIIAASEDVEAGCAATRGIRLIFVDNGSSDPARTIFGESYGCRRARASVPELGVLWAERSGSERGAPDRARTREPKRQAQCTEAWIP